MSGSLGDSKMWYAEDPLTRAQERGRPLARKRGEVKNERAYAVAMSGNTASILVFSVAALNGLTM